MDNLFKKYDIDPFRGFLPGKDPLENLSAKYAEWDEVASLLPQLIEIGTVRSTLEGLPRTELNFNSEEEAERAMLLLSCFAHAYVHAPPEETNYVPENIAIPWAELSARLQRKPILSHPSLVLRNWRRKTPDSFLVAENLEPLCQFHGSDDESWFYMVTVEIEQTGAQALPKVVQVMNDASINELDSAALGLEEVIPILSELTQVLKKMYDRCKPEVFYSHIRPYLASFENIEYRGTSLPLQSHHGGSAAQSSLLQFFDSALGIRYENPATAEYLKLMRQHMPKKHAEFLSYMEQSSTLGEVYSKEPRLRDAYLECIELLTAFRTEHMKIVALYITQQAKKLQSEAVGTGGTNPMVFVKSVRDQTRKKGGK